MPSYTDKDGLERDVAKLSHQWNELWEIMKIHWKRFFKEWDGHAYVNLFVESRRAVPYLMGHIDAILYPALIISIVCHVPAVNEWVKGLFGF